MYKIIGADKKEYGPVSADQIHRWISEGRMNGETLVQTAGDSGWKPLSAIPEFAEVLKLHSEPSATPPDSAATTPAPPIEEILARDYNLDIGSCLTRSWELLKKNFWPVVGVSLLVTLVMAALNQIIGLISQSAMNDIIINHHFTTQGILLVVLTMILSAPIYTIASAGLFKYYLNLIRGRPATINDAFSGFSSSPGQLIKLALVQNILIWAGIALCVIPGIYLGVAWYFSLVLVIDRKMPFWDAMETSRKVISKHWFLVFGLVLVVGLIAACGIIACCVGIFATMPLALIALMYAYEDIFSRPVKKTD